MARQFRVVRAVCVTAVLAMFTITGLPTTGFAEPPPWAPAHGYRNKHQKQKTYKNKQYKHKKYKKSRRGRHRRYEEPSYSTTVAVAPSSFGVDLGNCNRQLLGSVLGAATGAAVGSQIGSGTGNKVAIVGGTFLGFLVGGAVGRSMDEVDQNCVGQALERAETGQTIAWNNADTGGQYQVTPTRTYQDRNARYCREYTTRGTIDGRVQQLYGTACRQPDGTWEYLN